MNFISNFDVVLETFDEKIKCRIKRHLSPNTVTQIVKSLPLNSTLHYMGDDFVYFQTSIKSGIERPKSEFKCGEIAFFPGNQSICIFLKDATSKTMTPIGNVTNNSTKISINDSNNMVKFYATG